MKIKALFDYRLDPDAPRTLRQNALRWLAGFFALMLGCTLVSRAADSLTVPQVEAEAPSSGAIAHTVRADGFLEASGQSAVNVAGGLLVRSVAVKEGDRVAAGDTLFTLDTGDLREKLLREQLEVQKLNLLLEQKRRERELELEKQETALTRAQEDYDLVIETHRNRLIQAGEDRRKARQELRDYVSDNDIDPDEEDRDQDPQYFNLRDAYRAAQRAYEDAQYDQMRAALEAERAIEDAQPETADASAEQARVDIQLHGIAIGKLQTLLAADGEVAAPDDAVISRLAVSVGGRTADGAAVLFAGAGETLAFSGEIEKEDARLLTPGDAATVELADGKELEARVLEVKELLEKAGAFELRLQLSEALGRPGMAAAAKITRKTKNYPLCVPVSALRSDGSAHYLLVLRERETVLGVEQYAERVDVIVEDKNEARAAVSGALNLEDRVIASSGRAVAAGDRVRLSRP